MIFTVLLLAIVPQIAEPTETATWGLPLEGSEAEEFLKTAEILSVRNFETKGITRPKRVELNDGQTSCFAVFKTVDEYEPRKQFADGATELGFSDSYKYEIAAYELDKLLGLGIVPPAVERRIKGDTGSLSLWVEGAVTEWERLKVRDIHPPYAVAWNNQMYTVRLFLQLIYDTDFNNIANLLVTPDWKIYKIDSSRAFRTQKKLRRGEALNRFSRPVLEALRGLTKEELTTHLDPWLTKQQIKAVWARRGLILELADQRIAEHGEEAALYD
jgi:hypothetical protein